MRLAWPTKTLPSSTLRGSRLRIVTTGAKAVSLPLPNSLSGLTGAKLKATIRWSATWMLTPQY